MLCSILDIFSGGNHTDDSWAFICSNLITPYFLAVMGACLMVAVCIYAFRRYISRGLRSLGLPGLLSLMAFGVLVLLWLSFRYGEYIDIWFAVPCAMTVSMAALLCGILHRYFLRRHAASPYHVLGAIFLFVWSLNWTFYYVGLCIVPVRHAAGEVLFYSAVCSLDAFMLDFNGNVIDNLGDYETLKQLIITTGTISVLCSASLLCSLIIGRILVAIRVSSVSLKGRLCCVYVFFGLSEQAVTLAKTIPPVSIIGGKKYKSVIFFVTEPQSDDDDQADGWSRLTRLLSHPRKSFDVLKQIPNAYLMASNRSFDEIEATDVASFLTQCGLSKLENKIRSVANGSQLHLFFLSDDRDANFRHSFLLNSDCFIKEISAFKLGCALPIKTVVYCEARYDGVTKNIENMVNADLDIEIKVIDNSHLSIEKLKQDTNNHPVKFVDFDYASNPGVATSAFNALVVGFGETGQDAVRFLYEYGAFLAEGSDDEHTARSPFYCHIVDSNMDSIRGRFKASIPGAFGNDNAEMLHLYNMAHQSEDFYSLLDRIACSLNYVVIALGDDEVNIEVAEKILYHVRRRGADLSKLRIYVRAYENGRFSHSDSIAQHLNYILASESKGNKLVEVFGDNRSLYTFSLIIEDVFRENAMRFYQSYRRAQNAPAGIDSGSWAERRRCLLGSMKKLVNAYTGEPIDQTGAPIIDLRPAVFVADSKPKLCANLEKLRRQESQDYSNAVHANTKIEIIRGFFRHCLSAVNDGMPSTGLAHSDGVQVVAPDRNIGHQPSTSDIVSEHIVALKRRLFDSEDRPLRHIRLVAKPGIDFDALAASGEYKSINLPDCFLLKEIAYEGLSIDSPDVNDRRLMTLLRNLAITEHLRWVAAHELMGYTINTHKHKCEESKKLHNCLRPWEDLDRESLLSCYISFDLTDEPQPRRKKWDDYCPDYKAYDYAVVENSLLIESKRILKQDV